MSPEEREWEQYRRWRPLPGAAQFRAFEQLVKNEFETPEQQSRRQANSLRKMVAFTVEQSPYYATLFARLGLTAKDIESPEDLRKLPIIAKHDVLHGFDALSARALPPGDPFGTVCKSSGTTGRQVAVRHSRDSIVMSAVLLHRSARWAGLDPMGVRVEARASYDVGSSAEPNPNGRVVEFGKWRNLGKFFETGPSYGFNVGNPVEDQLGFLRKCAPDYASSYPGTFEEWLFANGGQNPCPSIKVLLGHAAQLTEGMQRRIEAGFGAPVHMGYGLNEIGKVAARCSSGCYHVHTETVLVEIVRDDGSLCSEGETGHLLVTGLRNHAMPLFRYDTGDLAVAAYGPCSCGRLLPGFAEIVGRYRRFAGLPHLSRERVRAIRSAVEAMPPDTLAFLRRYQIHQDRENRFAVRLKTVAPIPEEFRRAVLAAWAPFAGDPPMPLPIVEVDAIATSPAGKLLDFVSDFYEDSSAAPPDWVRERQ
jgi:phenylacetate-CoA ligase